MKRKGTTMRLYERNPYQKKFHGTVLSCEKDQKGYKIVMDQTCFYPEGGGQPADHGTLNEAKVLDVQEENGQIIHWTDSPLPAGSQAEGQIDWERRFYFMQNHTGEHLVSGLIHKKYGYENVGFHMNEEMITIDIGGVLSQGQLDEIEKEANEKIAQNIEVEILYPSEEERERLAYRSKKEIEGQIRIIRIPECDTCACCGTHVKNTLEIGMIKFLTMQHYKAGVRVTMICGKGAFQDYKKKHKSVMEISRLLSAKPEEVEIAVKRLKEENQNLKQKAGKLKQLFLEAKLEGIQEGQKTIFLYEENLEAGDLRHMMNALTEKGEYVMVIVPGKDSVFSYAAAGKKMDSREFCKAFARELDGKGGGSAQMVQGTVKGTQEEIKKVFLKTVEEN